MIDRVEFINVLGDLVDTSWGKASTNGQATWSIKASFVSDSVMLLRYTTVIVYDSEQTMRTQKDRVVDEATQRTASYIKRIKAEFKERTGQTLVFKEVRSTEGLELTHVTGLTPRRTAYYRRETYVHYE